MHNITSTQPHLPTARTGSSIKSQATVAVMRFAGIFVDIKPGRLLYSTTSVVTQETPVHKPSADTLRFAQMSHSNHLSPFWA